MAQDNEDRSMKQRKQTDPDRDWEQIEYDEEDMENDFVDDEDEGEREPPFWLRKRVRFWAAMIISLMLLLNVLAFLPQVFSLAAIEFIKKSRELSQQEDIQRYKEAVVVVRADNRKGTGFNIHRDGIILTNDHVMGNMERGTVSFPDGKTYGAEVIDRDEKLDIAVLKITSASKEELSERSVLKVAGVERTSYAHGQQVYIIGNPLSFNGIANEGVIYNILLDRDPPLLAVDAPVYKGNSGSPVIQDDGKVIGVIFATTRINENGKNRKVGLAVPMTLIYKRFPWIQSSFQ